MACLHGQRNSAGGDVEGDSVQPCLGRGFGLPATPGSVRANKRLLGAVFGCLSIPEDAQERVEDSGIALSVQAVEVLPIPGLVAGGVLGHL